MARKSGKDVAPIIIKREEVIEGGHHGGAWKVAYADFVTAMMAFFLVMWLINATTDKQRRGIADYFSPIGSSTTRSMSGSGKPFGGFTPYEKGSLVSNRGALNLMNTTGASAVTPETAPDPSINDPDRKLPAGVARRAAAVSDPDAIPIEGDSDKSGATGHGSDQADEDAQPVEGAAQGRGDAQAQASGQKAGAGQGEAQGATQGSAQVTGQGSAQGAAQADASAREQAGLTHAAASLMAGLAADPTIAALAPQISAQVTPEGLRIQIVDAELRPMFDAGSAEPNARARLLLAHIAPVLERLDEPVSVAGHTDSAVCLGSCRSNWDLSAARAEATRAVLQHEGLGDDRIADVSGVADRQPLLPADPLAAANRRIVMLVRRMQPVSPTPAIRQADPVPNPNR